MIEPGKITEIKGTITLKGGGTTEFSIRVDAIWQQWGTRGAQGGEFVDALDAMSKSLAEESLLASDSDDEDEGEHDDNDDCMKCLPEYQLNMDGAPIDAKDVGVGDVINDPATDHREWYEVTDAWEGDDEVHLLLKRTEYV